MREDPFSSYRAGFEVRTYRLCQRALMFHHFPDEAGVGNDCLVRSADGTVRYHNPAFRSWLRLREASGDIRWFVLRVRGLPGANRRSDRVIGTLNLGSRRENAYSRDDEALLGHICDSIAVALENAQLFAETRQRAAVQADGFDADAVGFRPIEIEFVVRPGGRDGARQFKVMRASFQVHAAGLHVAQFLRVENGGQGVHIDDEAEQGVLFLIFDHALHHGKIVAEMEVAGGLDAGEDAGHCRHVCHVQPRSMSQAGADWHGDRWCGAHGEQ